MGSGQPLNTVASPGGKGANQNPMQDDPFLNTYGLNTGGGGKGGSYTPYTTPGYNQRLIDYETENRQLNALARQNLASRPSYSSPYVDNFQQFTGNYSYQQPYYMPPPQQFYSPPQQYYSPYMNQFQMAGSQFYQQPYSYQPQPSFYQPLSQMGGRSQMFGQQIRDQFQQGLQQPYQDTPRVQFGSMTGGFNEDLNAREAGGMGSKQTITDPETGRSFVVGGPMQQDFQTGQAYKRAMANAGIDEPRQQMGSFLQTIGGKGR